MSSFIYAIIPFIAWFFSGILKFLINYIRFKKKAIHMVGNGGFPSTHTAVASSITMLIGFSQGFGSPMFGLGVAFLFITMIDALGIRNAVGKQASIINKFLIQEQSNEKSLREKQGHNKVEILGGLALGTLIGFIANFFLK